MKIVQIAYIMDWGIDIMIVIHLEEDMKPTKITASEKIVLHFMIVLAVFLASFSSGHTSAVHAATGANPGNCGQLLADAQAGFLATLAPDGSVPATTEVKAAAQEYIRVSKLCYDEISAQNSAQALQGSPSTFIDDGGMLAGSQSAAGFVPTYKKWGSSTLGTPGGTVTYSFMGNGKDLSRESSSIGSSVAVSSLPGFQPCFITEIQTAFAAWQAVANIQFVQVDDNGAAFDAAGAAGDIRIAAHVFDGPSGTLAHAFYPPSNGTSAAGDIHFDSQETWSCNNSGINIGVVALHEIGHSLGLAHENTGTVAVMDPYYNPSLSGLQADDVNGAASIYGPASLVAAPLNDNFLSAIAFTNVPFTHSTDTTSATGEPTDPIVSVPCDGFLLNKGNKTVWYKYTPTANTSVSIDTLGSDYDTYLSVWTYNDITKAFTYVACDDDTEVDLQSQLTLNAVANQSYYIEVAGYTGYQGTPPELNTGGMLVFNVNQTNIDVLVGGAWLDKTFVRTSGSVRKKYVGEDNGPVKIASTDNVTPILASERFIYSYKDSRSYAEMMGYPNNRLTTQYWFPWYNNVSYSTQLRVSNMGSNPALVKVYAAGSQIDSFTLIVGEGVRKAYVGLDQGPLQVVSTDGVTPILASERFIQTYLSSASYSEMMGYPGDQLSTQYWFPWYNNKSYSTQLRVTNLGGGSAQVKVYAGSSITAVDTFTLSAGEAKRISYNIDNGPLHVVSTDGVTPILASERFIQTYLSSASYAEMMGYSDSQLTTQYCFPWYNNIDDNDLTLSSQLRVSNMGAGTAAIKVYLAGSQIDSFNLGAGLGIRTAYPNANDGPLCVVSTDGVTPILASERFISTYLSSSSYSEIIGYPKNRLAKIYWFPWYNNMSYATELRMAIP
jgi:hypothetical protein